MLSKSATLNKQEVSQNFSQDFSLENSQNLNIGAIFTPLKWCEWLIEKYKLLDALIAGKTFFDPTAGSGNFILAFIDLLLKKQIKPDLYLKNLYLNEINQDYLSQFWQAIEDRNVNFPLENCWQYDFIQTKISQKFDILIGNPPWCNFVDLPENYKQTIKKYFIEYGLVKLNKNLLLGASRVDLAALITQIAISNNLKDQGEVFFFLPASIFQNQGAHEEFRKFATKNNSFALLELYDFANRPVFPEVGTRYVLAHFQNNQKQSLPIAYYEFEQEQWQQKVAAPVKKSNGPLAVSSPTKNFSTKNLIKIDLSAKARQGINTCGANTLFFFDRSEIVDDHLALVSNNKTKKQFLVERAVIYPLISKQQFQDAKEAPVKFVLLPHNPLNGKPFTLAELELYPLFKEYLYQHKAILEQRKGVMLRTWINKGRWWAFLGVGTYAFAPYKVVWQAYGKSEFKPIILSQYQAKPWMANQSLQAFMPFNDLQSAKTIIEHLDAKWVTDYLLGFKMQGHCNWAQPSRINDLLAFTKPFAELFTNNDQSLVNYG